MIRWTMPSRKACVNVRHGESTVRPTGFGSALVEVDGLYGFTLMKCVDRSQSDNVPDQRGPGVEHPFVKTDHRSSVGSDGYPARFVAKESRIVSKDQSQRPLFADSTIVPIVITAGTEEMINTHKTSRVDHRAAARNTNNGLRRSIRSGV